jgi:hypothetical protein
MSANPNTMWRLSVILKDRNCEPNWQIRYLLDCGSGEAKQRTSGQCAGGWGTCNAPRLTS